MSRPVSIQPNSLICLYAFHKCKLGPGLFLPELLTKIWKLAVLGTDQCAGEQTLLCCNRGTLGVQFCSHFLFKITVRNYVKLTAECQKHYMWGVDWYLVKLGLDRRFLAGS